MTDNIHTFLGSVSSFMKTPSRKDTLIKGAYWAGGGAALAAGGAIYNNYRGRRTLGGDAAIGVGIGGGAIMGGRALGVGRLLTAGGLQRMGNDLKSVDTNRFGKDLAMSAESIAARGLGTLSKGMHSTADFMASMTEGRSENIKSRILGEYSPH